ncbi:MULTISPECIES: transglutaminase family protein [Microbacterium]|uniref:transglutaminase family protein n=1 Tax=Microbacterium TaxID=33882 RepID=UPI00300FA470
MPARDQGSAAAWQGPVPSSSDATGGAGAERGTGVVGAALITALCLAVAVWPLLGVIQAGRWSADALGVALGVLVAGVALRLLLRGRPRAAVIPVVLVGQALAASVMLTVLEFRAEALAGVLPTPEAARALPPLFAQAWQEVLLGSAPLESTRPVAVVIALGVAALAIVLDLLVVVLRVPLLAVLAVAGVGVVPAAAVPGTVDVVWFVALAVVLLVLLRVGVRRDVSGRSAFRRDDAAAAVARPPRPRTAAALAVGAAAVVAALAVSPILPVSATGVEIVAGSTALNPTMRLGEDLRRPTPRTALTLITDAASAPYLRIATLSAFDGEVWHPDRARTSALRDGLGAVAAAEGVALRTARTSIRVTGVSGSWLPLPYQATTVRGLNGSWIAMRDNRTVIASDADAADQNYTVESASVQPTLEQVRAASAAQAPVAGPFRDLPADLPPVIEETARQVAGAEGSDYDRMVALQTWFRAGFRYSEETPVAEGFDGTGVDAVEAFLTVREGYCVHFAGAFALMARSLGMPTRIVVGYLPGTASDQRQDGGPVYLVTSDQLHSWPEVYFEGLGWIPFEPTATRGVPTRFETAANGTGSGTPAPTEAPTSEPTAAPATSDPFDRNDQDPDAGGAVPLRTFDPYPLLWTILGVLAVVLLPALARAIRRAARFGAIRRGDATAAWAEVRDSLLDLGLPASSAESPRTRGARLTATRDVDPGAVRVLVTAVERASYARTPSPGSPSAASGSPSAGGSDRPAGGNDPAPVTARTANTAADGAELASAVRRIRADLAGGVSARDRILAALAPRSLFGGRLTAASVS